MEPHGLFAALEFPSIDNLVKWPSISEAFFFNKIALILVIATLATTLFFVAANRKQLVPTGVQNLGESAVNFINEGIIQQTIGQGGEKYLPFIMTIFFFVFVGNIFEIIPVFAMPANARLAGPLPLAIITWLFFICVGFKHHGPKYILNEIAPSGVPKLLLIFLVAPIEFISVFILRPFSLTVRLFANMLAGHILLVTFAVLTIALVGAGTWLVAIFWLPFLFLVIFTAFEILVAALQAYVFAILAAVYIGGALHPAH